VSTRQPNRFPSAEFLTEHQKLQWNHRALIRIFVSAVDLVRLMSSGFRKNFEEYARRCLELARLADTETRARLLGMARDYMRAAKEGEHDQEGARVPRLRISLSFSLDAPDGHDGTFARCVVASPDPSFLHERRVGARTPELKGSPGGTPPRDVRTKRVRQRVDRESAKREPRRRRDGALGPLFGIARGGLKEGPLNQRT
jgi:hypothetical protein